MEKAHNDLVAMKHEKNTLNMSIKELQDRLTRKETEGPAKSALSNIGTVEEAMRRGEREKDLEKQVFSTRDIFVLMTAQLVKAKRDKDKALKLLIQLIGKVLHNSPIGLSL